MLQDRILHGSEHEADVLRISGAGEMGVDDLVGVRVQIDEHLQYEFACSYGISWRAVILGKIVS